MSRKTVLLKPQNALHSSPIIKDLLPPFVLVVLRSLDRISKGGFHKSQCHAQAHKPPNKGTYFPHLKPPIRSSDLSKPLTVQKVKE